MRFAAPILIFSLLASHNVKNAAAVPRQLIVSNAKRDAHNFVESMVKATTCTDPSTGYCKDSDATFGTAVASTTAVSVDDCKAKCMANASCNHGIYDAGGQCYLQTYKSAGNGACDTNAAGKSFACTGSATAAPTTVAPSTGVNYSCVYSPNWCFYGTNSDKSGCPVIPSPANGRFEIRSGTGAVTNYGLYSMRTILDIKCNAGYVPTVYSTTCVVGRISNTNLKYNWDVFYPFQLNYNCVSTDIQWNPQWMLTDITYWEKMSQKPFLDIRTDIPWPTFPAADGSNAIYQDIATQFDFFLEGNLEQYELTRTLTTKEQNVVSMLKIWQKRRFAVRTFFDSTINSFFIRFIDNRVNLINIVSKLFNVIQNIEVSATLVAPSRQGYDVVKEDTTTATAAGLTASTLVAVASGAIALSNPVVGLAVGVLGGLANSIGQIFADKSKPQPAQLLMKDVIGVIKDTQVRVSVNQLLTESDVSISSRDLLASYVQMSVNMEGNIAAIRDSVMDNYAYTRYISGFRRFNLQAYLNMDSIGFKRLLMLSFMRSLFEVKCHSSNVEQPIGTYLKLQPKGTNSVGWEDSRFNIIRAEFAKAFNVGYFLSKTPQKHPQPALFPYHFSTPVCYTQTDVDDLSRVFPPSMYNFGGTFDQVGRCLMSPYTQQGACDCNFNSANFVSTPLQPSMECPASRIYTETRQCPDNSCAFWNIGTN